MALTILVVTSQLPPDIGGTSVHAAQIAIGLQELGHTVSVVIRDRDPATFAPLGLDVICIDTKTGLLKPLRLRRARNELMGLIKSRSVDVVFFAYGVVGFGDIYGEVAKAGIPYVVGIHGLNASDFASAESVAYRRRKWGLPKASRVICCTKWLAELARPLLDRDADVVHYGIDPRIDDLATPDKVERIRTELELDGKQVLLFLGRLVPRKNLDAILRVFPRLAERFENLVLLVVGSGKSEPELRALAQEGGAFDKITWVSAVPPDDVGAYYKVADLFVTVALTRPEDDSYETFGLVYAEANMCGVAVVGGKEGGVPEAVQDGETGLLVHAGDDEALHDAVAELLADPVRCKAMAAKGAERVRSYFRWERAAQETAVILAEAAGKPL